MAGKLASTAVHQIPFPVVRRLAATAFPHSSWLAAQASADFAPPLQPMRQLLHARQVDAQICSPRRASYTNSCCTVYSSALCMTCNVNDNTGTAQPCYSEMRTQWTSRSFMACGWLNNLRAGRGAQKPQRCKFPLLCLSSFQWQLLCCPPDPHARYCLPTPPHLQTSV